MRDGGDERALGTRLRPASRAESGFTLVEVIVAIVILTLVGLSSAQFAITAIRSSTSHQQRSAAVSIAASGIEDVRDTTRSSVEFSKTGLKTSGTADPDWADEYDWSVNAGSWSSLISLGVVSSSDDQKAYLVTTSTVATSTGGLTGSGSTTYTRYILYRVCYRSTDSSECTDTDTSSDSSDSRMVRVAVAVTWNDAWKSGTTALYTTSILLDDSGDTSAVAEA